MRRKQEFVRNGVCVHGKGGAFHRMRSECAKSRGDDEGGIRREVAGWRVSRTATEVLQQHVGQTEEPETASLPRTPAGRVEHVKKMAGVFNGGRSRPGEVRAGER